MHDQGLRAVRRALEDVWESGGRRFVTIEDADDDDRFVQYIDGQLNVAWPFDAEPEDELAARGVTLPGAVFAVSWSPGGTLLLAAGDLLLPEAMELVEDLVDLVLEADDVVVRVDDDR